MAATECTGMRVLFSGKPVLFSKRGGAKGSKKRRKVDTYKRGVKRPWYPAARAGSNARVSNQRNLRD